MGQIMLNWGRGLYNRLFMNPIFKRVVKNSSYLFSMVGISAALSMLQGILIARMLGVENYGILGTITAFTSMINKFASFKMSELVVKYVGHYSEIGDDQHAAAIFKLAFLTEIITSFFAFGLAILLAPIGAKFFAKDLTLTNLFSFYALIILANLTAESSTGLLQIFDRFRRIAIINLAGNFITIAIVALAFFLNGNLITILTAYLVGKTIAGFGLSFASFLEAMRRWGSDWWRLPLNLLWPQARELAHFAFHTNISATISLVTKDSEVLWVSLFRNPIETGWYKLALSMANIVLLPISPLPAVTYPELSRQFAQKGWDQIRYILRQGSILAGSYSGAATIFLIAFGMPLIALIYSPQYIPAYPALIILLFGYLISNIFYWRRPALLALGCPDYPAKVNFVLAIIKIIGTVLFVPRYGYLVSAALLAGFYWIGSFLNVIKIRSVLPRTT